MSLALISTIALQATAPVRQKVTRMSPKLSELISTARPLRLEEAVELGIKQNPGLQLAASNLRYVIGRGHAIESDYLPKLGASPGLQYISRVITPAYSIQATLPLDISHLLAAANEQAKFAEISARLSVNQGLNDVVYKVKTAYFEALRSQALVRVEQDDVKNSAARLDDANARYAARVVAYIDVVRAQTDLADAQRKLIDAQTNVTEALATLALAIGVDPTSRFSIADDTMPTPPAPSPITPGLGAPADEALGLGPDFQSAVTEAKQTRPEILGSQASVLAAQKGIALANTSMAPSLVLGFGYYDLRSQTDGHVNEPQGFVGFNFPIYDGGLAKGRIEEGKALVDEAKISERQLTDRVSREVQSAYLATVRARGQLSVAQQALKAAQMAFDLAKVRYQTGVSSHAGISPLLELSDAQVALTQAEQNAVNAQYDASEAQIAADHSVGRFSFSYNPEASGGLTARPSSKALQQ